MLCEGTMHSVVSQVGTLYFSGHPGPEYRAMYCLLGWPAGL